MARIDVKIYTTANGARRWRRNLAWTSAAIILGGAVTFATLVRRYGPFYRRDLQVHVTNAGQDTLHAVSIYVTGNTYALGDLAAGHTVTNAVKATGESHVEVSFESSPGVKVQLDAGGYFEPRYVGDISFGLNGGRIVDMKQEIFP